MNIKFNLKVGVQEQECIGKKFQPFSRRFSTKSPFAVTLYMLQETDMIRSDSGSYHSCTISLAEIRFDIKLVDLLRRETTSGHADGIAQVPFWHIVTSQWK